jgi:D-alanine-D-alanine ligase
MDIGIAFDLKPNDPPPAGAPDDVYEEFDAPVTIKAIGDVFRSLGHTVRDLGDGRPLLDALLKNPPDFVFNFAEGTGISRSRESRVPAVCEMLGIPYSGSDPLVMAVALDKEMTRRVAETAGVRVPDGITFSFPDGDYDGDYAEFPAMLAESGLTLPVIAKPVCEGSSKGIRSKCLIESADAFGPTIADLWRDYRQPILVEEFLDGDELTVGVIGNDPPEVFGVMAVRPKTPTDRFVYSVDVKRDYIRLVDYECPAPLPLALAQEVEEAALSLYTTLGCRDVARLDFRLRDGVPYFLEINPLPGLNPESSDLVIMARLLGVSHADLVGRILSAALTRCRLG